MKNSVMFATLGSLFLLSSNISYADTYSFTNKKPVIASNIKPSWLHIEGSFFYDGETDDLVTAGHGFTQLSQARIENQFVNDNTPTAVELRKARLNRYIDIKTGEGTFFGFKQQSLTPLFDGRVAGTEIQASLKNGDEKVNFLLQIPLDFNKHNPCIVAIPSIDVDGLYNPTDIQIRGLWGLKHDCAVVYNDKGLGNGLFDITNQNGYLINGQVAKQTVDDDNLLFSLTPGLTAQEKYTNRYAIKQLYSQQSPEQKWGQYVLDSITFAFYEINEMFSPTNEAIFNKDNTLVLVYGTSDGGSAALKAGELDHDGIIDGIVAVNPQIQIANNKDVPLLITHGQLPAKPLMTKSLIDYSSYGALYIPCAVLALKEDSIAKPIPYSDTFYFANNRCMALKEAGLLSANTPLEQANEALEKLYQYGWTSAMTYQLPYYYYTQSTNLPYRYISQYGRYSVQDQLCGYSVASIDTEELYNDGAIEPLGKDIFPLLWAKNDGSLPIKLDNRSIVIDLVNDNDPDGPHREFYSRSKNSHIVDYNLSGVLCLRDQLDEQRVNEGLSQVFATGNLNQIKTIIVHGQLNVKNLPNYSSRAYVALNSHVEGDAANLKYIEVENASYLNSEYPFDNSLVPIDYYGENAIDWLWSNLTKNTALPDSQIIRTHPRGGQIGLAPTITLHNIGSIEKNVTKNNRIIQVNGTINLPD
ncbi:3-hydroxybutyrate oligomer hydrolase family protein [Orbus mooreae]|uniref:3-hydroxybutyrate oligomer hydrolase family protein n=1 Tax=Orbus mooreae TaxID=3074107 RepID=UPI00370DD5A8